MQQKITQQRLLKILENLYIIWSFQKFLKIFSKIWKCFSKIWKILLIFQFFVKLCNILNKYKL